MLYNYFINYVTKGDFMEIAIVDDLYEEREEIHTLISKFFSDNKKFYNIVPSFTKFNCGEDFMQSFKQGKFQLVLLDIYMKEFTGIDIAKKLYDLDKNCNIIFFTSSLDHILEGYDVQAAGYILKPASKNYLSLAKALNRVMEKINIDNSSITLLTEFGENTVFYRDIVYLEISMRNIYVHFVSGTIHVLGKFSDYEKQLLLDKRFLECYRNIIVNIDYVDKSLDYDFILKNGEKIPISRRKKAEVMNNYTTYLIERRCCL